MKNFSLLETDYSHISEMKEIWDKYIEDDKKAIESERKKLEMQRKKENIDDV